MNFLKRLWARWSTREIVCVQCSTTKEEFEYRGYKVRWTGWKENQATNIMVGQWVAYPPNKLESCLYICVPTGRGGRLERGQYLNIDTIPGDPIIFWDTGKEESEKHRKLCKRKILELIDQHWKR